MVGINEFARTAQGSNEEIMLGKKPAFGGYSISFSGKKDTIESIMGSKPIAPSMMTKKIWEYVKKNNLSSK
ncbi:MAG: hypothetical protein V1776_03055 [Candidatus Diapherotrites archaeon]